MSTKTEIGNVRLYLFWSLLKIPRFFSITGNRKQKIWLKQPKAASALDFSYFQHVSKLVTHHTEKSETVRFRTSFFLFDPLFDPLTVLQLLPTDGVLYNRLPFDLHCPVSAPVKKGQGKSSSTLFPCPFASVMVYSLAPVI